MIGLIVMFVGLAFIAAWEYATYKTGGIPTIASFPPARRKMIEVLEKESAAHNGPAPFDIIDFGSGNGQLVTKIARTLPNAKVTGIELSPIPYYISALRRALFGPANLELKRADFWPYDCSKADAVIIYLDGPVIKRMGDKFRAELKPGAIVVSNEIALQGDWQPIEAIDTGFFNTKVFVYRQN